MCGEEKTGRLIVYNRYLIMIMVMMVMVMVMMMMRRRRRRERRTIPKKCFKYFQI